MENEEIYFLLYNRCFSLDLDLIIIPRIVMRNDPYNVFVRVDVNVSLRLSRFSFNNS